MKLSASIPSGIDLGEWSDPDKLVVRMRSEAEAHPATIIRAVLGPWTLCFSMEEHIGNIFSAKVHKRTKERDWQILGRLAAGIGAPDEARPATLETNANATHYWIWGGVNPDAVRAELAGFWAKARSV